MRTSLNEVKNIEDYLLGTLPGDDRLLFEAHILLDENLGEKVNLQKQTYELINAYSRKKLKQEIASIHQRLFSGSEHRSFRNRIMNIFFNSKK